MKKRTLKQSTLSNLMMGISILFALATCISAIITTKAFIGVTNLNKVQTEIYSNMRTLLATANYSKDMVRAYSQSGDVLYMDMYNKGDAQGNQATTSISSLKGLVNDPGGQKMLEEIVTQVNNMAAFEAQAISLIKENKLAEAQGILYGKDYGMAIDGLNVTMNELELGMVNGIGNSITLQSNRIMYLGISILSLSILQIFVQISNSITTHKLIIQPLIKLKNSMMHMSEGHLTGSVDVQADHTEIGSLAGAMYSMRNRMDEYIKEISIVLHSIAQKDMTVAIQNEYVGDFASIHSSLTMIIESLSQSFRSLGHSTDDISASAEQVSNAAQALAQGAVSQASSVDELSASINAISDQLAGTADHAKTARELAVNSEHDLNTSNQQMTHLIQAISEISNSSSEISKIMKTIEDIAFQTNILALNAAVEAARAGSAGKGFAVVADEVRNLATKSSEAAKQTNVLIDNSVQSVQRGVRIADETAHALTDVVVNSHSMAEIVSKISIAASEQALAIVQINLGVEQISSVVQSNSATSEQSAATSQDLSSQTVRMKQLVSSYKIKHD